MAKCRGAINKLIQLGIPFDDLCLKQVGNGQNTGFRTENWSGVGILKDRFPRAFDLERNPRASVADRMGANGYVWDWRRLVRGGREETEVGNMMEIIGSVALTDSKDKWRWSLTPDGAFSVESLRAEIEKVQLGTGLYKTRRNNLYRERTLTVYLLRID